MSDDFDLLDRWGEGDKGSGEALFERYFDAMYRFFGSKAAGDVSDLVQRTFLACVEGRARFRRDASFRTFLYAVARNELHRHWRLARRDDALDFGVTSIHDVDPSPSTMAVKGEEERVLLQALRLIPVDLQIAVELHYWEGFSGPQIAQVLDIPEGTVRSRLRRALEMLRLRVAEVADSAAQLQTTLSGLDGWAEQLRKGH